MKEIKKMTDYMAKMSYTSVTYPIGFPTILADEYWDYYIDLLGQTEKWNNFKRLWKEEGFTDYYQFMNRFYDTVKEVSDNMIIQPIDDVNKIIENYIQNMVYWKDRFGILEPKKYIKVDIHSASDAAYKEVKIFNDKYESTQDIINQVSKYEIFKDMKFLRIKSLWYNKMPEYVYMKLISRNVLLRRIYESNCPAILELNKVCDDILVSGNDMYLYNVDDVEKYKHLCGDYTIDNINFNISIMQACGIEILGHVYNFATNLSKNCTDYNLRHFPVYFIPLMLKVSRGERPTEKDLAIGYEDQVFFHLNENDYKIL